MLFSLIEYLGLLSLIGLLLLHRSSGANTPYECNMAVAEDCFTQLFDNMPICSASEESAELAFRCVHYNVLDECFSRQTEPRIKCAPKQIGLAARTAYSKRVDHCLFTQHKNGAGGEGADQHNHQQQQAQHRRHHHHNIQQNGVQRTPHGASIGLIAPPTELQFISLFGYLQIQCRPPPPHRRTPDGASKGARRSHLRDANAGAAGAYATGQGNCSATQLDEMVTQCETEIRKRQPAPHFELERHRLLRVKLDASSKLLQFPETRPEDECLMVRSVLSDIYLIHQKYCFHATVTKCMCERFKFERMCGVQCANLEPFGLPLTRELQWTDFRGRLSAAPARTCPQGWLLIVGTLLVPLLIGRISSS